MHAPAGYKANWWRSFWVFRSTFYLQALYSVFIICLGGPIITLVHLVSVVSSSSRPSLTVPSPTPSCPSSSSNKQKLGGPLTPVGPLSSSALRTLARLLPNLLLGSSVHFLVKCSLSKSAKPFSPEPPSGTTAGRWHSAWWSLEPHHCTSVDTALYFSPPPCIAEARQLSRVDAFMHGTVHAHQGPGAGAPRCHAAGHSGTSNPALTGPTGGTLFWGRFLVSLYLKKSF